MAREPKNTGAAAAGAATPPPVSGTATSAEALLSGAAAQNAASAREPLKQEGSVGLAGGEHIVGVGAPIVEHADASLDRSGEPASATLRAERLPVGEQVLVDERADVSRDRTGEPASATLRAEPVRAATAQREAIRHAYADTTRFAGTLPAHERVLPDGERVTIARRTDIGEEREFTATVRTLRNGVIYEIGADVPLSATEFVTKKAAGAVLETEWDMGRSELD